MLRIAQAALLAAAVLPLALPAQAADGYWSSRYGAILTSSKTGMCIKTRYWKEGNATPKCKEKAMSAAMKK